MKKLTLISALILVYFQTLANHFSPSNLTIQIYDETPYVLMLDGYTYENPLNNFFIANLNPGEHKVTIQKKFQNPSRRNRHYEPALFNGCIRVGSGENIFSKIDRMGNYQVVASQPLLNTSVCPPANFNQSYQSKPEMRRGYMNDQTFFELKSLVKNTSFDSDKLNIAQQAISTNGISVNQLNEILNLFSFDSKKLELAKYAYQYTADKQNYFIVNSNFTFSSDKDNLQRYIAGR